eukprot:g18322.t1
MRRAWQALLAALCLPSQAAEQRDDGSVDPDPTQLAKEIMAIFQPQMAKAFGRLSGLSYCGLSLETPAVENCPECRAAGFEVVKGSVEPFSVEMTYHNTTYQDANFWILGELQFLDVEAAGCFVTVRGSANSANWVQNSMMDAVDPQIQGCKGCGVREGYYSAYQAIVGPDKHGCGKGQNPIWVSGHSLGGAVAHLLIAGLTGLGYTVALSYVLEPALSGNDAFRHLGVAKDHPPVPAFSLTNGWDWVPRMPSDMMHGYDIHSDPWSGSLSVCFDSLAELLPAACSPDLKSWWTVASLTIDHTILWYAPNNHMILDNMVSEVCKAHPNRLLLAYQLTTAGVYSFMYGSGLSGFATGAAEGPE